MFKRAIVRKLSKNFQDGITKSNLGKPIYNKALKQHSNYVKVLDNCGLEIIKLNADDRFPDSTFVEDTAIVNEDFAIITNIGTLSRKGEEVEIKQVLEMFYDNIESIKKPGTVDGGDVMKVENCYYIGLSKRTNKEGARQLIEVLKKYGYSYVTIPLTNVLHLKSGVSYIGDNNLIAAGEFIDNLNFIGYNIIKVEENEKYAANSVKINNYVLIPKGFEKLKESILSLGYKIIEIEMSEFRKMDGGLSCLSLRF